VSKFFVIGEYLPKLQVRAWLSHALSTLIKDEGSARDNHFLACNFAQYLAVCVEFCYNYFSIYIDQNVLTKKSSLEVAPATLAINVLLP